MYVVQTRTMKSLFGNVAVVAKTTEMDSFRKANENHDLQKEERMMYSSFY